MEPRFLLSGRFGHDERESSLWRGKISGTSQVSSVLFSWMLPEIMPIAQELDLGGVGELVYSADVEWSDSSLYISAINIDQGKQEVTGKIIFQFVEGKPRINLEIATAFLDWDGDKTVVADQIYDLSTDQDNDNKPAIPLRLRSIIDAETSSEKEKQVAADSDNSDGDNILLSSFENQGFVQEISALFVGLHTVFGDVPARVNLASKNVSLGQVQLENLNIASFIQDKTVQFDSVTLRGKSGLSVQISGDASFSGERILDLQASAAGSDIKSALDMLELIGFDKSRINGDNIDSYRGLSPFSVLAKWDISNTGEIRINASGTVGGAQVSYAFATSEDNEDNSSGKTNISLFHPDLRQWLEYWGVAPPDTLSDNQEISARIVMMPEHDNKRQVIAEMSSGEADASLSVEAVWQDNAMVFPAAATGNFTAKGDDPRWWVNIIAPGLGARLGGPAQEVDLPYRFSCKVRYEDSSVSGEECVSQVSSSRVRGGLEYKFADAGDSQGDFAAELRFDLTVDKFNAEPLLFMPVAEADIDFRDLLEEAVSVSHNTEEEIKYDESATAQDIAASSDGTVSQEATDADAPKHSSTKKT